MTKNFRAFFSVPSSSTEKVTYIHMTRGQLQCLQAKNQKKRKKQKSKQKKTKPFPPHNSSASYKPKQKKQSLKNQ